MKSVNVPKYCSQLLDVDRLTNYFKSMTSRQLDSYPAGEIEGVRTFLKRALETLEMRHELWSDSSVQL